MAHPNNVEQGSRVRSTIKWREIFTLFDGLDQEEREAEEEEEEGEEESSRHRGTHATSTPIGRSHGDGVVQFLPGDIKGLETKLNYLLGEYRAGNRSPCTRNEIVSILDELLRRKRISRKEYRDINTFLK